jgi:hypothetical protein
MQRPMRFLWPAILSGLLVFMLSGCFGRPSPEDAVDNFLSAFLTADFQQARGYMMPEEGFGFLDTVEDIFDGGTNRPSEQELEVVRDIVAVVLGSVAYEIKGSETNEDQAIVEVQFVIPDFDSVASLLPVRYGINV